jgi:hypothetical protein
MTDYTTTATGTTVQNNGVMMHDGHSMKPERPTSILPMFATVENQRMGSHVSMQSTS